MKIGLILAGVAIASVCPLGSTPSIAQTPSIRFTVGVPPAPAQMQIYKLSATDAPIEFLNEKLVASKLPALKLEGRLYVARGATGQNDLDRLRAYADSVSGDAHFIPNFADLVYASETVKPLPVETVQSQARSALADERFIPRDVTELRLSEPIAVTGGAMERSSAGQTRTEPRTMLTIVPAFRYVSGYPVYGRGSHAVVSFANDGSMVGALRRWRKASLGDRLQTSITADQVRTDIERQLRPFVATSGTIATVDTIEVAYYDGNANYLQPVYYFEATLQSSNQEVSDTKTAGYVPIGKSLERIPDLAAPPRGPLPAKPAPGAPQRGDGAKDDITLGEYANEASSTNSAYFNMANNFLDGLNSVAAGTTPPVNRTQWLNVATYEVAGPQSKLYLNSVNVAYTEPHGNWLLNSTLDTNFPWYVANIGTGGNPGFGAAAGGVLATWIIMSCEVIPSMFDRQYELPAGGDPDKAFDAWWPVFQGLHNVLGFRTIVFYPQDDFQFNFGHQSSMGGDINAVWFQEVATQSKGHYYGDTHLIPSYNFVRYWRASTMIDARNLGQSIFNVEAQSPATKLWNFWMNN